MSEQIQNQEELERRLAALGSISDETRNAVTCALIGHSHIITSCFGYQYCGRCREQIGDSLASVGIGDEVVIGHKCPTCTANYEKMDWRHKVYVPDPFAGEKSALLGTDVTGA